MKNRKDNSTWQDLSIMWTLLQGAGTAIGELPPYFMARAARLSGQIDEEEQEIEELIHEKQTHPSELVSNVSDDNTTPLSDILILTNAQLHCYFSS